MGIILNTKTKESKLILKKMLFNIANRVNRNANASRPALGGSRGTTTHYPRYTNEYRVPRDEPVYTNPPLLSIEEILQLAEIEENGNAEMKFGESLHSDAINTNILSDTIF